ncbi:MAG: hypothetical protein DUD33_00910 [Coriobacteriaceae bacterium]|jgi:hypothetical protein|nr:hypothetical protein [Olsenella sp.]MCI1288229.1 hypothetical protein [Olsenella sp.]RRF91094.1 MAG: hypothetical protein DUD33_00910 [Coriobacteriaceae bacterium]
MKTAKELENMFGISSERIREVDEKASRGELEGDAVSSVTGPGRPPMFEEPVQQVTFKESSEVVRAMDRRAKQLGIRRSDYLRRLVENDLNCML